MPCSAVLQGTLNEEEAWLNSKAFQRRRGDISRGDSYHEKA
jgi:hypothetical protein